MYLALCGFSSVCVTRNHASHSISRQLVIRICGSRASSWHNVFCSLFVCALHCECAAPPARAFEASLFYPNLNPSTPSASLPSSTVLCKPLFQEAAPATTHQQTQCNFQDHQIIAALLEQCSNLEQPPPPQPAAATAEAGIGGFDWLRLTWTFKKHGLGQLGIGHVRYGVEKLLYVTRCFFCGKSIFKKGCFAFTAPVLCRHPDWRKRCAGQPASGGYWNWGWSGRSRCIMPNLDGSQQGGSVVGWMRLLIMSLFYVH